MAMLYAWVKDARSGPLQSGQGNKGGGEVTGAAVVGDGDGNGVGNGVG